MQISSSSKFLAAALVAACAAPALAQTAFNPLVADFEYPAPWYNDSFVLGFNWHVPGSDPEVRLRTNGDGLLPAVSAKAGSKFVQIAATGTGGFRGVTTDLINNVLDPATGQICSPVVPAFCATGPYPFHDYTFDFNGGDLQLSVWYNIPGTLFTPANPAGEIVLIKAEIKGGGNGFQNNAGPYEFSVSSVDVPTTNGQWVQISATIAAAQIRSDFAFNVAPPQSFFPAFPEPNRVKVTVGRFSGGANTGTVLFDKVEFSQGVAPPACLADVASDSLDTARNPNSSVGSEDLDAFIAGFIANNAAIADVASDSLDTTYNPNNSVGSEDLDAFIAAFIAGC